MTWNHYITSAFGIPTSRSRRDLRYHQEIWMCYLQPGSHASIIHQTACISSDTCHHQRQQRVVEKWVCSIRLERSRHQTSAEETGPWHFQSQQLPPCFEFPIPLEDHRDGCGCSFEGAYVWTQSGWGHAIGIQSRTFYWNCIGQSEERYPDFHGQKPMCSACVTGPLRRLLYGQSFNASESAATSHRPRRDNTHMVWVILERTHTGSIHPRFNSAIRWTATLRW